MLASLIVVPVSATQNQNFPRFQFPIGGDDLMNTARITSVNCNGMQIALASGDVHVSFLPQLDVRREVAGSSSDVTPGRRALVVSHPDRTDAIKIYS